MKPSLSLGVRGLKKLIPGVDGKCGMFAFIVFDRT
jgi:hypothetical protein